MDSSASSELRMGKVYHMSTHQSLPPKWKTFVCALSILSGVAIGGAGLAMCGFGAAGYFHIGALSNMAQIHAIIMMAAGAGVGITSWIFVIVGVVKNRKPNRASEIAFEQRHQIFIERTSKGIIRDTEHFGKAEWETYFGTVGDEPPLPHDIDEILNSPCPFSEKEGVLVRHTHMLVLIPATVNGEELNFNTFEELIKNPKQGHKMKYESLFFNNGKKTRGIGKVEHSHWILMTRDILPGSVGKTYNDQKELVKQYADQGYTIPDTIDATVGISVEFVVSGKRLYSTAPPRLTRTAQLSTESEYPVVVGGLGCFGLNVSDFHGEKYLGVAALRKFEDIGD